MQCDRRADRSRRRRAVCQWTIEAKTVAVVVLLLMGDCKAFVHQPIGHALLHNVPTGISRVAFVNQAPLYRKRPSLPTRLALPQASAITTTVLPFTYMFLLAVQFAVQPVITKRFAPKTIIRSTYVLAQDFARLVIVASLLTATQSWNVACQHWTYHAALATAGFPAILYLIQAYCSLIAYQNLSPITYNVLNQTKTLSAAVCCFLLFGQRQSLQQVIALSIMLLAALVMEKIIKLPGSGGSDDSQRSKSETSASLESKKAEESRYLLSGMLPILVASFVSGLAGAWTQRSLRGAVGNNSLLFTLQLSVFSILLMGATLLIPGLSPDRERIITEGWSVGWTMSTWIPIVVNAIGGILVGLVTKFSGAVPKGFALIAGTFMSGILQNTYSSEMKVSSQQWIGGFLAAISVWMHSAYPYATKVVL
jgi:solute carrier family 35 (UDP-sugar transporter), member A1/2/3